jgi:hypothetical protein
VQYIQVQSKELENGIHLLDELQGKEIKGEERRQA